MQLRRESWAGRIHILARLVIAASFTLQHHNLKVAGVANHAPAQVSITISTLASSQPFP